MVESLLEIDSGCRHAVCRTLCLRAAYLSPHDWSHNQEEHGGSALLAGRKWFPGETSCSIPGSEGRRNVKGKPEDVEESPIRLVCHRAIYTVYKYITIRNFSVMFSLTAQLISEWLEMKSWWKQEKFLEVLQFKPRKTVHILNISFLEILPSIRSFCLKPLDRFEGLTRWDLTFQRL